MADSTNPDFDFSVWRKSCELSDPACELLIAKHLDSAFVLSALTEKDIAKIGLEFADSIKLHKGAQILSRQEELKESLAARAHGSPTLPDGVKATTKTLANLDKLQNIVSSINNNPLEGLLASDSADLGKGEKPILTIDFLTNFAGNTIVETPDEVLTTADGRQITVRAPKKRPQPETLLPHQWIAANARILKLLNAKNQSAVPDYCDYMIKIGDYLKDYTASSVFYLDHQHHLLVANSDRKWSDIDPHYKDIHLKLRAPPSQSARPPPGRGRGNPPGSQRPGTQQELCFAYNSRAGCDFKGCRYLHVCTQPGCTSSQPSYTHGHAGPRFNKPSTQNSQPPQSNDSARDS